MEDVIVVGSGPAGALTAYLIAREGLSVLILEKLAQPRYKTCGGGISLKTIQNIPFDISHQIEVNARGGIIAYQGKILKKIEAPGVACLVQRQHFDHFLVQQAQAAGAKLRQQTRVTGVQQTGQMVTVETNSGIYTCRYLVGADGTNSLVARSCGLGFNRPLGMALEAEIKVPDKILEQQGPYAIFDFGALPFGYGWVFPKREHLSVGIFNCQVKRNPHLRNYLDRFINWNLGASDLSILTLKAHPIPIGGTPTAQHSGNVLLVGDAANLADAWMGEGISNAVQSAHLAAETIIQSLKSDQNQLQNYSHQVNSKLIPQLKAARDFSFWVYHFPHLATLLIQKSPCMQSIIFGNLRGEIAFSQLNSKILSHLPHILWQTLFYKE